MILRMLLGVCLSCLGGVLLTGAYEAITKPDIARVMDVEMTKPLLVVVIIFSTLLVFSGYLMFSSNYLLAASSLLQ